MSATDLLQELVRIPSVNPDHAPGTTRCGEGALASWLSNWLRDRGAEVDLEEIQPGRPNLIARFAPRDGRPRILLGPHLDTVGIEGMTIEPFSGEIRDGRLWGRGACDTKGPMAAMLWGLHENAATLEDSPVAIDFVAFMGEESGQWGSRHFAGNHAADYQFAIVGEPTDLDLVHVTKGSLWATLATTGRAAHSSMPERGENAVMTMVRALPALEAMLRERLATFTHPVLGRSTLNVGRIRGGTRPNIVPDHCEVELDLRTTPSLRDAGGALKLVHEGLAGSPIRLVEAHDNPPMETPGDHPWIESIRAVRPASKLVGAPWFSDAAHLSAGGIPSICLGPGSIDQAHTCDEFIEISALEDGAALFTALVRSLSTNR